LILLETPKFEKNLRKVLLIEHLFSYLETSKILNETSAGYFQKVLLAVFNKRGSQVLKIIKLFFNLQQIASYIFESKKIQNDILKHAANSSINSLLLKLLCLDFVAFEQTNSFLVKNIKNKYYNEIFFYLFKEPKKRIDWHDFREAKTRNRTRSFYIFV
jgi:hypothetical protein